MEGVSVAQSARSKRAPKVLKSMTIEPAMGGGHTVTHHYASYQHESEVHNFTDGKKAMAHIAKHAGLPLHDADRPDPITEDREEL
jgi:hypothetical protein